jgi:hypothetical protein
MSHLVARLGDLLHFSAFARRSTVAMTGREGVRSPQASEPTATPARDDLAFFSLSVEHAVVDRRSDLDRLGLINLGEEPLQEID